MPTKTKEQNEEIKKKKTSTTTKKSTTSKKTTSSTKKSVSAKSTSKKEITKKEVAKKATTKSSTTKKASTSKVTAQKTTAKKTTTKKSTKKTQPIAEVVEYYDLPYRYNETIVKILYQTPDTLFVYWDISDEDRENYIKQYGENFFNITRPVLIVHNDDINYSFEVPINDFANSWYLRINDSKCHYRIELGRRPNYYNEDATKEIQEKINSDYIYISDSNKIELPNDKVLFNTNENNTIKFRNVKNSEEKYISLQEFIKQLPAMKKSVNNIPYISEELLQNMYSAIYQNEDITLFDRITNPSSGNPSSGSMSSRFN